MSQMKLTIVYSKGSSIMRKFIGVSTTMAFLLCSCIAECPARSDTVDLDLQKLSGKWFVVSATPPQGKSLSKCGSFTVTPTSSDTFIMNYTAFSGRKMNPITFTVHAKLDDDVTGNWQLQGSSRILGPYKHRIIDVDYGSYFAMIACGGDSGDLPVHEFAMTWSREKTLSPGILNKLEDKIGSYINRLKILTVDHSSC